MTEWEKMLAGLPSDDRDEEVEARRLVAKRLFRAYNRTTETDVEVREKIKTELFRSVGKNVFIEPDFICELGSNITIGDNVFINFGCIIFDMGEVTIGDNAMFGPRVGIYTTNHAFDAEERVANVVMSKPIHIGNRVWLSADVKIVQGVTIGDNSIIGAGSVVTKDIPSNVIAAGNPCRVIRKITDEDKWIKKNAENGSAEKDV